MSSKSEKQNLERDHSALLRRVVIPALLVILMIFFSFMAPRTFFTWYNIRNILSQSSYAIIAAVGLTFVMIGGGVDLSIGYIISLCGVVLGMLMVNYGLNMWASIFVTLIIGVLLGLFNGFIVVKLKVFPLIITLSTSMIFQGLSYTISKSATTIGFSDSFKFIGQGFIGPVPFCVILSAIVVLIAVFFLEKTYCGRYVYATGGNDNAAKLSGINTDKIRLMTYAISGFCSAFAGVVLVSRTGVSASTIGPGTEFTALSGCILGGVSLTGGEGGIIGMLCGALIITILGNGMQLMHLGTYPQFIATGTVLIAAIAFDVYQKNKKSIRKLKT